ncbi:hypothetical protein K0504_08165 [Neiella marina]|uniref:Phage shock protein B n=1 Tax=Neiella holothuriorum TaxID=2870530 RepID=A0ABS7EF80_9GAMM|nr:hypothetical protein [Neiella holothuriorum]MBW8191007.1 hypothetical protein [Neiella holothuriorum]
MSGTTLVFLIVVTVVIGGGILRLIDKRMKYKDGPKIEALERQLSLLEQDTIVSLKKRIQVLEKIVTDEGYELRRTISKLDQS